MDIGAMVNAVYEAGYRKYHNRPDIERWFVELSCNRYSTVQICLKAVTCSRGVRVNRDLRCISIDLNDLSCCETPADVAWLLFGDIYDENDVRGDRLAENTP